jgi:glutathione S-transferase
LTEVIFYGPTTEPLSDAAQSAAQKLFLMAQTLLASGNENLFGEWSIADVDLALMLNRLALNGDPVPQRLMEYAGYQWKRPSVQRWVTLNRPPL